LFNLNLLFLSREFLFNQAKFTHTQTNLPSKKKPGGISTGLLIF